jgi:hypothetical protein
MGKCQYCGKEAGWFKKAHKTCEWGYTAGIKEMKTIAANAIVHRDEWDSLEKKLVNVAVDNNIPIQYSEQAMIAGWERALEHFLEDNFFSKEEEICLLEFQQQFNLSQSDLDKNGAYTKAAQSSALREIMEGNLPNNVQIQGNIPFNLQKQEKLVWMFNNVDLYEEKVQKEYVGGYAGVSIKIAKGVYYRTGAFKGHPVEKTTMVQADSGIIGVTDKHIYFSGKRKNTRTAYSKIVNFTPYSDGIGVHPEARTAKPQIYILGDGWFIFNLVKNLAQL